MENAESGAPSRLAIAFEELARDLRWTWSHEADALWRRIDPKLWDRTRNPWLVLQSSSSARLAELAEDPTFRALAEELASARRTYIETADARAAAATASGVPRVAYFSMEFGLGEALPLYSGGLGILAGDVLKTASDLGLPLVGVGLLYQSGYFRQLVDADGRQHEIFPYNEPASLPIEPVRKDGDWFRVVMEFPGRRLRLRVWRARVGRIDLYLLDSNDPLNHPVDRGITSQLYGGGHELRLMQELVLGVAGWRAVEALAPDVEICHINEGHAAFAVIERARRFMHRTGVSFREAFWATRAGNVFTTHTPVDAGFDRYPPELIRRYVPYAQAFMSETGLSIEEALSLGRVRADDASEPFTTAFLALRGSLLAFGVSRLHGAVSRRIFASLFPRWPEAEAPIGHITNGVHVPTWDSPWSDDIWTSACGRERWRCEPAALGDAIAALTDERIWSLRAAERADLVQYVRGRLAWQLGARAAAPEVIAAADSVLDPNVLTLGFARRFASYKRPNLLLKQPGRLVRLLLDPRRPAQLVVAGKAHPRDDEGKAMIREWVLFAGRPDVRHRIVFLEDYDISLAQQLVEGVDVWINTPRRPLEACGTSGMKTLVNGGLNLSVRDGWWAEAYRSGLGWALESAPEGDQASCDDADAEALYALLEQEVAPEFYDRDAAGVPRRWVQRVRRSMATLTVAYSSNRMMLDYIELAYLPAARRFRERAAAGSTLRRELVEWARRVQQHWGEVRIDEPRIAQEADSWSFVAPVYLGGLTAADVRVELYADPVEASGPPTALALDCCEAIPGAANGFLYRGRAPASRPARDYTARVIPAHPHAVLPLELPLIRWQR